MEYLLVGRWLLAFAVLSVLAFPLCARLFPRFPGRGAGFAPIVALTVLTTVAFWTGRASFGPHTALLGLVGLGLLSAWAGLDRDALRRGRLALAADLRPVDGLAVAASAAMFAAAFLFLAWIRAADPAVAAAGGEKFLDYGLLRTTLRAETLPPTDAWFAGETVRYYYGGHLAAALVTILTATPPAYAYNLALAGAYACLVAAAFDLARAVAVGRAAAGDEKATAGGWPDAVDHGLRAGLVAAFFVGLAGNLVTAGRLVLRTLPERVSTRVARAAADGTRVSADDLLAGVEGFHYWTASRVVPGTINEFPFFAFLNGDLHAHMLGAPFLLFGAALAYAYWETPAADRRRRRALVFGAIPALGGIGVAIHTWDFPALFGLLWLALAFAPATPLALLPRGDRVAAAVRRRVGAGPLATELERTGGALVVTAIAGGFAVAIGSPFVLGAGGGGQGLSALDPTERSGLGPLLLVHGAFLAAFLAYLGGRLAAPAAGTESPAAEADASTPPPGRLPLFGGVAAVAVAGLLAGFPAVAVAVPLVALGWTALRFDRDVGFETVLLVGGAGLVGLVEVAYVSELAGPGRLNTVFKVYFQAWVVWGVAAGVVLADVWTRGVTGLAGSVSSAGGRTSADGGNSGRASATATVTGEASSGLRGRLPAGRTCSRVLVAVLLLSTAPYAGLALDQHFGGRDVETLHATAFVDREHPEETPAIRWLDENADRDDVLLEAPGTSRSPDGLARDPTAPGTYSWRANPASSLTGVPTVAGWAHQVGYRGREPYYDRVADVDRAYAGTDTERAAVLRTYDVTYVWVGPTERERYGEVAFDGLAGVDVAFETERVTVYRVDRDELAA